MPSRSASTGRPLFIWNGHIRKATPKKWLLEVYGRARINMFKALAEELAKEFDVEINVRLECENEKHEW